MLKQLVQPMVDFSRKKTREYVASIENNLVASCLNIINQFWTQFIPIDGVYELPEGLIEQLPKCLEKFVLFGVLWGACAQSDNASRRKVDVKLRELLEGPLYTSEYYAGQIEHALLLVDSTKGAVESPSKVAENVALAAAATTRSLPRSGMVSAGSPRSYATRDSWRAAPGTQPRYARLFLATGRPLRE